ncbi:hypothetical protein DRQ50_09635 [bacterium]|nr:MAG: hypothetical protein DRQ50_09635 [bacterium]
MLVGGLPGIVNGGDTMCRSPLHLIAFACLALLIALPLGCGDDDPANPGGSGHTDQTAPLVTGFDPEDRDTDIPVTEAVVITFSEPMNTGTADGNITVDPSGYTSLDWNTGGTELTVTFTEPIASPELQPVRMSALLQMWVAIDPAV